MSNFTHNFEYWRLSFGLVIVAICLVVMYLICSTCHDIATAQDDYPTPPTATRSRSSSDQLQRQQHLNRLVF